MKKNENGRYQEALRKMANETANRPELVAERAAMFSLSAKEKK